MSDSNDRMCALNRLPPDLIEAILPFLPPKSLSRFKSVSKRWYSLISSPNFIKNHIQKFTKNNPNPDPTQLMLIPQYDNYVYSLGLKQLNTQSTPKPHPTDFHERWYKILGSCNGLVLASDCYGNLCLVNPTTGKHLKVPRGKSMAWYDTYGFGYDSSTDDYKVISISYPKVSDSDTNCTYVCMYSLRNNSWNMLPNFPYQRYDRLSLSPGVLINNNLHWVVKGRKSITIAAFSLTDEEFCEIEFPDAHSCFQIFAFGGKLGALLCEWGSSYVYELWVMEEYGVPKSWTKLCIIETEWGICYEFIAQVSNRDILLGNNDTNEILIYNMDERRWTIVNIEECCQEVFVVYGTYVEGLESLERFY